MRGLPKENITVTNLRTLEKSFLTSEEVVSAVKSLYYPVDLSDLQKTAWGDAASNELVEGQIVQFVLGDGSSIVSWPLEDCKNMHEVSEGDLLYEENPLLMLIASVSS